MKPILFNTEMVQAILDGRKTVTRRVIPEKVVDAYYDYDDWCNAVMPRDISCTRTYEKQYFMDRARCAVGDILYVRETWAPCATIDSWLDDVNLYAYRANYGTTKDDSFPPSMFKWRPSIHMPKEAARIFLRVTDVRVERLQEITEEQAIKEGATPVPLNDVEFALAINNFAYMWDSIIKPVEIDQFGWGANPWVWVIKFERISKEDAEKE